MNKYETISLKSYSPYSGIRESCLVEGKSGLFYPGVKIENISFPLTISAIQAAICSCLANGDKPAAVFQDEPTSELIDYWLNDFGINIYAEPPDTITLFNPVYDIDNIPAELKQLCTKAIVIHSNFPVSALLGVDGGYIAGVNVELNAWSQGLCAERLAISRAVSHGFKTFGPMHIHAPKSEFCSPCGACRQVLNEFISDEVLHLYHKDGSKSTHLVHHLLPFGFISDSLK